MDELSKYDLLVRARRGELTDAEFEEYRRLLREEPELLEELHWQEFIDDSLPESLADLALEKETFQLHPPRKAPKRTFYAIAASVVVLLAIGWVGYYYLQEAATPVMVRRVAIEVYNGDLDEEGIGFMDENFPIADIPLEWWVSGEQKEYLNYQFCHDTLKLFVRKEADIDSLQPKLNLLFQSVSKTYQLEILEQTDPKALEPCLAAPKNIMP